MQTDFDVKTTTTRLTLPTGVWIDIKDELTVRDEREREEFFSHGISVDGKKYDASAKRYEIGNAAVYIVNWSATRSGKPWAWIAGSAFKDRVKALESLPGHVLDMISTAIGAHVQASREAAHTAAKNDPAVGEIASEATSPSAS